MKTNVKYSILRQKNQLHIVAGKLKTVDDINHKVFLEKPIDGFTEISKLFPTVTNTYVDQTLLFNSLKAAEHYINRFQEPKKQKFSEKVKLFFVKID